MRMFNDVISKAVLEQLAAGKAPNEVVVDYSAPHLKKLLATAFAKALSELPTEKVIHCWAPLVDAYDKMTELHAEASKDLTRLFPNMKPFAPEGNEDEPNEQACDDFEDPADTTDASYERMYQVGVECGVPITVQVVSSVQPGIPLIPVTVLQERAPVAGQGYRACVVPSCASSSAAGGAGPSTPGGAGNSGS